MLIWAAICIVQKLYLSVSFEVRYDHVPKPWPMKYKWKVVDRTFRWHFKAVDFAFPNVSSWKVGVMAGNPVASCHFENEISVQRIIKQKNSRRSWVFTVMWDPKPALGCLSLNFFFFFKWKRNKLSITMLFSS